MRFLIVALVFTSSGLAQPEWAPSLTQEKPGFLNVPPCVLDFELGWNNSIKAGTARVTVQEAGGNYWRATAQASSTGFARTLWTYDCTMSSIIRRDTLHPVFMQHSETDRSETCRYRVSFQPKRVITESTILPKEGAASTSTHVCGFSPVEDLLSIILFVRGLPLANGESKLAVKIRKIDRESLVLSSYKKMKTATIWVSDDEERLPVEMRAEIFVGYMSCRLTGKTMLSGASARSGTPSAASMLVKPPM